ncbi:MAG: lytic transglycosylase domain-containing protein [Pyrinomonadaceae bacterium]
MKNFPLAFAIILLSTLPVFAQGGAYRVDNFDFVNAVKIETPQPVAKPAPKLGGKRLVSARNYEYAPANLPLMRTTSMNVSKLSGFTTGDANIDSFIVDSGNRNSVDPLLLYAIMHQESTFKPRAMSHKGARGLMQLMPGTALRFGVSSIWDPRQNIEGGARYMRFLLDKFGGDVPLALAGYNAGEGAVMKYGNRIPPYNETQEYVRRISRRYSLIRDPLAARSANSFSRQQVAVARHKDPTPLNMYERSVFAVRLPDGRLQLITQ